MSKLEKLGKLSLAILEHKVEDVIGETAIGILKNKYVEQANLIEAIANTEERFRGDYSDAQVTQALFDDLSLENLPSLTDAFEAFYKRPTEGSLHKTLTTFIQEDLKTLPAENVAEIVDQYLKFFSEELLQIDEKFRKNITGIAVLRGLEYQRQTATGLNELNKSAPPTVQENQEDQFKITISRLPSTGAAMFGRKDEIEMLKTAWNENQTNVLALVAWGGVGKSALVNHWLGMLEQENYRGARKVYAWSFYSQGAGEERHSSADLFIAHALDWFGDSNPETGSTWDKGERLAGLIQKQRALIILDGLEPLQHKTGEIKDPALKSLLRELAAHNPGLCMVTTRIEIDELKGFPKPGVIQHSLEQLSPEAGADYLSELGVDGTKEERQAASEEYGGHALALTLLGNYLKTVHRGDLRKRDRIPDIFAEPNEGGHARRVMASYEDFFKGDPALQVLYLLGLFDRPMEEAVRQALLAGDAIPNLTENLKILDTPSWAFALRRLREAGLLATDDGDGSLDAHPLVRQHFAGRLEETHPEAWQEAHKRLYEYYKSLPEKEYPDTLEELEPLYRAVYHGCLAGQQQEALLDVYWQRIARETEYFSIKKLGAFGTDLSGLAILFEEPWTKPAKNLAEDGKAMVLNLAGFALHALGRLRESVEPFQSGLELRIRQKDLYNTAIVASNLSGLHIALGNLKEAVTVAEQAVHYAYLSTDKFQKSFSRVGLATTLHQLGDRSRALTLFKEAEQIQAEIEPTQPWLYSLQGFLYCEILLEEGEIANVLERAASALVVSEKNEWMLDIALDHLTLGRARLLDFLSNGADSHLAEAESELSRAVAGLRQAGSKENLVLGLLGRAALWRVKEEWFKAEQDLAETEQIAIRCGMRLYLCDWHLESARLALAREDGEGAREHYLEAKNMVEEMSYHRRDGELEILAESLGQDL